MERLILRGAHLFDGTGRAPQPGLAVVVEQDRIADVVPEAQVAGAGSARVLDLSGCTLLPGLIDLHVHLGFGGRTFTNSGAATALRAARNARLALATGITTLRDVGTEHGAAIALRDAVRAGDVPGSRIVPCGRIICMTGGHGSEPPAPPGFAREADGPDDCRRAVREEIKAGADCIKVTTNGPLNVVEFTQEELNALVDEAHRCERRLACHASIIESSRMAVRAHVDTMEHGCDLDDALVRQMAEMGMILVPTLLVTKFIMDRWNEFKAIPMMRSIPVRAERHVESFQLALAAGVTMAAGTDIFFGLGRFDSLPEELEHMAACGMRPADVLVAGTRHGARALRMEDRLGTVERGKIADLLVVEGNPLADLKALRNVALVVQDGKLIGGGRLT